MKKVIRDGKVAVLYSPGFGAGWSTWINNHPELVFDPEIVNMVESGRQKEITEAYAESRWPGEYVCVLGAADLKIKWIEQGMKFRIDDYDGNESITLADGDPEFWTTA